MFSGNEKEKLEKRWEGKVCPLLLKNVYNTLGIMFTLWHGSPGISSNRIKKPDIDYLALSTAPY